MTAAKTMNRSRNQLASAYAPESFFTFEGGLGACISRSSAGERLELSVPTTTLISERMNEIGQAWFASAMAARASDPTLPQPKPRQCLDPALLDATQTVFQLPGESHFYLCKPSHMEYTPAPLTFVCRTCGVFKDYSTLKEFEIDIPNMGQGNCPNPKKKSDCDWEQLDVVFVHWSGRWEAAFPGSWDWSARDLKAVKYRDSCICGSSVFRLNRRAAGVGDWFFECAACDKPLSQKWLQNDKDSLEMIGADMTGTRYTDVRMQATPYRASSAYYVKQDLFIDFKEGAQQLLARLRPGREEELKDFIATQYGFSVKPITDEDVEIACKGKPDCAADWADYQSTVSQIKASEGVLATLEGPHRLAFEGLLQQAYDKRNLLIQGLRDRAILLPKVELPYGVVSNILQRQSKFASKFDPFRLAIEHATLKATRLDVETRRNGKKPYVSFTNLDDDLAPEEKEHTVAQQELTRTLLDKMGLADMGLIREFDLCRFSFGYSRMESAPVLRDKRGLDMPVRLRLFPPVRQNDTSKHPVYVVQQSNEAIYVRLNEDIVLKWLEDMKCPDMFKLNPGEKLGAGILSAAQEMGPFLDNLPESESPSIYYYVYSLLHSYSHLLMKHISEYSGLDLGSLGEYIFPADLAFVVYRNGTTMDLGNLSALWRNAGTAMLGSMLGAKATQCGTGTLCTHRGGACPDCVMVPETSCIASNKLLSRSVLRGVGGRPRFDTRKPAIKGYFDFVQAK